VMDQDSGQPHLAHVAWNALAILELWLRDAEMELPEEVRRTQQALEISRKVNGYCHHGVRAECFCPACHQWGLGIT
jgi:hypothetical protein